MDAGRADDLDAAADLDPGQLRPAQEHGQQRARAVVDHALERGRRRAAAPPASTAPGPGPAPGRASAHRVDRPSPWTRRRAGVVVPPLPARRCPAMRPRAPPDAIASVSSDSQASKWNGTVVTLAWGSFDTSAWMASAVRSCRMRCHSPLYLRSGSSTDTSVSPSDSSWATCSTAALGQAPVGAGHQLEAHPRQPEPAPLVGQPLAGLVVDHEVHGPQLVGGERAGVLDGPGRGQVEPVDEHHARRAGAGSGRWPRRGRRARAPPRSRSYWRLSRSRITTTTGMIGRITQASSNRVTMTMSTMSARQHRAHAVGEDARARSPFSRLRRWCLVMPDCDSVNPVNTEMA